jgi:hypothetical protein
VEEHRALALLDGRARSAGYFDNVESRIEQPFGVFELTPASKVLLVGSGESPMTPLYLAVHVGGPAVPDDRHALRQPRGELTGATQVRGCQRFSAPSWCGLRR